MSVLDWTYLEFTERPLSDSCWSVQTGPDGRVYIACCCEFTGGQSATLVRYDEEADRLEYLFDVDEATGDLRDSGRATQCKIHDSLVPERSTGILYAATHLSGPPIGEQSYNPWAAWHDARRAFRGAYLLAYDTAADQLVSSTLMIPREGCRCMALDEERRILYALTYPRDHFVSYDLRTGRLTDYGRVGSVNNQCIVADCLGRVFFFADSGRMMRFDPERRRLEELPLVYPHAGYQTAWHGVLYDAAADPLSGGFFFAPWKGHPRLARYWPHEGPHGRLEDLGPLTQDRDESVPITVNLDHVGGLLSDAEGGLYFTRASWAPGQEAVKPEWSVAELCRRSPSGTVEVLGQLQSERGGNHYVSRTAVTSRGTLILGKILTAPAGVYRVKTSGLQRTLAPAEYLRSWG